MFYVVYLCATTSDVVVTIEVYLLVLLVISFLHVICSDRRHAGGLFLSFQLYVYLYGAVSWRAVFFLYVLTTHLLSLPSGLSDA